MNKLFSKIRLWLIKKLNAIPKEQGVIVEHKEIYDRRNLIPVKFRCAIDDYRFAGNRRSLYGMVGGNIYDEEKQKNETEEEVRAKFAMDISGFVFNNKDIFYRQKYSPIDLCTEYEMTVWFDMGGD